ncbi:MAG: DUF192 domain-containing protein [Ideonella sp.]
MFVLAWASANAAFAQAEVAQDLPTLQLSAGIHNIKAMVARSTAERSTGLMFRKEMAANDGMLFVFEAPAEQCFWMRNTLLPLSAAFVLDDGTISNIEDMKPLTLDGHCSTKPVRFVLEMQQGWFAKRGIKAGSKLSGAPFNRH